jgi:hypothetical protein
MIKPLLLDQVASRELHKCGLLPKLSQSGIVCCSTALAFESPTRFENYKRYFDSGGNALRELAFDENSHNVLRFIYTKYGENERITYYDAAAISMASFGGYVMIATEPVIFSIATELNIEMWDYSKLLGHLVERNILHPLDASEYLKQLFYVNNIAPVCGSDCSEIIIKSSPYDGKQIKRVGNQIQKMPGYKAI